MRVILKIWIPISIIYISFFLWYTNLGGKLTSEEIDFFNKKMFEIQKVEVSNSELHDMQKRLVASYVQIGLKHG